jgi:hypothetical protein
MSGTGCNDNAIRCSTRRAAPHDRVRLIAVHASRSQAGRKDRYAAAMLAMSMGANPFGGPEPEEPGAWGEDQSAPTPEQIKALVADQLRSMPVAELKRLLAEARVDCGVAIRPARLVRTRVVTVAALVAHWRWLQRTASRRRS